MPLIAPHPIDTERLHVRRVNEADIPALFDINGDPEVTKFLPYPTWQSRTDGEALLRQRWVDQDEAHDVEAYGLLKHECAGIASAPAAGDITR